MSLEGYIPLSTALPDDISPSLVQIIEPYLDDIAVLDTTFLGDYYSGSVHYRLYSVEGINLDLPNFNGLGITIGEGYVSILVLFQDETDEDSDEESEDTAPVSQWKVYLEIDLLHLNFPRTWLIPAIPDANGNLIPDPNPENLVSIEVPFGLSLNENFQFEALWPGDTLPLNLPPAIIGNTGMVIILSDLLFSLNGSLEIPGVDPELVPEDFSGIYVGNASLMLPPEWEIQEGTDVEISGAGLFIGTGGLTGVLGLSSPNSQEPVLHVTIGGGFTLELNTFAINLKQSKIIGCDIRGTIILKGFKASPEDEEDAHIHIDVYIDDNGDFSITASEDQGIQALHLPGVFSLHLDSLTVGKRDGRYYVAVSGLLDLAAQSESVIGDNLPSGIPIPKMVIWEDGGFEFEGGAIVLPKAFSLKLGPAAISVTAIHIGSHEQDYDGHYRKFKYFGFDGGISVNPGGVDARGDGIKMYYTVDMEESGLQYHSFLRIQSLVIDIVIPDTADPDKQRLMLHGYLAMKEPTNDDDSTAQTDYSGGIAFKLNFEKLKIAGSADMRYNPALPSFLVDIGIELPVAIPVGTTGLGIYGFRGLIGSRYVASRSYIGLTEEDPWYMYYKEKTPPIEKEGITASKFSPERGLSLGAGVSFATAAGDSGKFFSSN